MSLWRKVSSVTIQMKATEQYFPVVLFTMLSKMILTFESLDEFLKCNHSSESYWAVLSCGVVYYVEQDGSVFRLGGWDTKVWHSSKSYFPEVSFFKLYKVVLGFKIVNKILKSNNLNETIK